MSMDVTNLKSFSTMNTHIIAIVLYIIIFGGVVFQWLYLAKNTEDILAGIFMIGTIPLVVDVIVWLLRKGGMILNLPK